MSDKDAIRKLLPKRAANALLNKGINTFELIKQNYPEGLLRVPGLGMSSFRAIEAAFFPGKYHIPAKKKISEERATNSRSEALSEFLSTKLLSTYKDLE